jgi:hypothetical protein
VRQPIGQRNRRGDDPPRISAQVDVSPERIFGTEFDYDSQSGEVRSILRTPAGYGKVRPA